MEFIATITTKALMALFILMLVVPIMAFFCGPQLIVMIINHIWTKKTKKFTIIALKLLLLPVTYMIYLMKEGKNIRKQQIEDYYKSNHHEPQPNRKTTLRIVKPVTRRYDLGNGN